MANSGAGDLSVHAGARGEPPMPSVWTYLPPLNLKTKFALTTGAMILVVATGITGFLTHQQESTIRSELVRRALALTENLAYNCQLPLVTQNTTSLLRLGNGLLKDGEVSYVQFEDSTGTILARVGDAAADSLEDAGPAALQALDEDTRTTWMRNAKGVRFLDVFAPVTLGTTDENDILSANRQTLAPERVGSVHVGMTTRGADGRIAALRRVTTLLGILVALAGSVGAAFAIHSLTRPLAQLMEGNRRVARGDFGLRLEVRSRDEFGRLAGSWNQMADEIQRSRELVNRYFDSLRANAEELEEANRTLQYKNEEIAKASRMKSEFLAIMSHELRTPLNGILGFSEVLLDEKFGRLNEKQKRFVDNTLTSGRHLLRLINDLLDLSKIEAGKMEIEPAAVEVVPCLEEIHTLVRGLALKKGVELHFGEPPAQSAFTDAKLIKQVMFNLLSNAIKFTPTGGRVDVEARCPDGRTLRSDPISRALPTGRHETIPDRELLCVEVRDTGIGIAPEDYEKIFMPFQQLDSSYARRQEGTGLGLALTRRLVRLLGGDIWFTSQPGEGSRFVFYVPLEYSEEDFETARAELDAVAAASEAQEAESDEVPPSTDDADAGLLQQEVLWPWGETGEDRAGDGEESWTAGFAPDGQVAGDGFPSWAGTVSGSFNPARAREDA
jgi:signal transduction histidine kinase